MYGLTGGEMDNELMCPRIKIFKTLENRQRSKESHDYFKSWLIV